jgi:hypothetical protein
MHIPLLQLQLILAYQQIRHNLGLQQGKVLPQTRPRPIAERRKHHVNIGFLFGLFPSVRVEVVGVGKVLGVVVELGPAGHD